MARFISAGITACSTLGCKALALAYGGGGQRYPTTLRTQLSLRCCLQFRRQEGRLRVTLAAQDLVAPVAPVAQCQECQLRAGREGQLQEDQEVQALAVQAEDQQQGVQVASHPQVEAPEVQPQKAVALALQAQALGSLRPCVIRQESWTLHAQSAASREHKAAKRLPTIPRRATRTTQGRAATEAQLAAPIQRRLAFARMAIHPRTKIRMEHC